MPYLLYQLWSFTAPALYRHEKKLIMPLVISSTMLFYIGLLFSFYIVFPVIFTFLSSVGPESVDFAPDIQYYLDFILKVSFAFGVAFEVPIATILLIMFGATTAERLKKNRAYIIIGSFALGMVLTPRISSHRSSSQFLFGFFLRLAYFSRHSLKSEKKIKFQQVPTMNLNPATGMTKLITL